MVSCGLAFLSIFSKVVVPGQKRNSTLSEPTFQPPNFSKGFLWENFFADDFFCKLNGLVKLNHLHF